MNSLHSALKDYLALRRGLEGRSQSRRRTGQRVGVMSVEVGGDLFDERGETRRRDERPVGVGIDDEAVGHRQTGLPRVGEAGSRATGVEDVRGVRVVQPGDDPRPPDRRSRCPW